MNPLNNFTNGQNNNNDNNPMNMMGQFMNFAKGFNGNPEQIVQNMLNSGQLTQEQLNQIMPMAQQMANNPMVKGFLSQLGIK